MRTKDKPETHTPASLVHTAEDLEQMAARLRAASTLLDLEPVIPEVKVRYEMSLVEGLQQLRTWVNEAAKCASDARREAARHVNSNGRIRKTGHVSDAKTKT